MTLSVKSSGRRTLVSSLANRYCAPSNSVRRIRFAIPKDLRRIIVEFNDKTNVKAYEELVCSIRDFYIEDDELSQLLQNARENISLMGQPVHHFVHAILKVKWTGRIDAAARNYQEFLVDLLSAHNYYTKFVFDELIHVFKSGEDDWKDDVLTEEAKLAYSRVHEVLNILLHIIPMSLNLLKETVEVNFPYLRRSSQEHKTYICNMIQILEYQPVLRTDFLFLIINKLLVLDVNAPKHEIIEAEEDQQFQMDIDSGQISHMRHPIANTLDHSLHTLLKYAYVTCYNTNVSPAVLRWEETKQFFQELLSIFDCLILPTHATHHVQFILFYITSFKVTLADMFLTYLWQKVTSPRVANVIRQTAAAYTCSFLARAKNIGTRILMNRISEMTTWAHNYIAKQDAADYTHDDIKVHPVFYSVCQAIFYVVSCRYSEFVNSRKGLTFLQCLNLTKIVTCKLNPLKVCLPEIVESFAAITRNYQLVYCYTIIEHNSRMNLPVVHLNEHGLLYEAASKEMLDTFFPFDAFRLKISSQFITSVYHEFKAPFSEERMCSLASRHQDDSDDFLSGYSPNTSTLPILSVSPQF